MTMTIRRSFVIAVIAGCLAGTEGLAASPAATVTMDVSTAGRLQTIDGFGSMTGAVKPGDQAKCQELFFDDLEMSILRIWLQPEFVAPYGDLHCYSPWFMGKGVKSAFNIDDEANPGGPEGNLVRTYTKPEDYSREFGGKKAPIAVMGPDIAKNIALLDFKSMEPLAKMAQAGLARKEKLGDFKLFGSYLSLQPWLKHAHGTKTSRGGGYDKYPWPDKNVPWPFVWNGNYSGGMLDVSDKPLELFNDGTGPTSALTQFARGVAAHLKGFQDKFGLKFYAISLQNELNMEEPYSSTIYLLSSQYIAALKAARREMDKYPDLKDIKITGPEDCLADEPYSMWQYGGGDAAIHKNLQHLQNIAADPKAAQALAFFCTHAGTSPAAANVGAGSPHWNWWANGWSASPGSGIPADIKGFTAYGKNSWMTEYGGPGRPGWRWPVLPARQKEGVSTNGAWFLALGLQQALTTGRESAFINLGVSPDPQDPADIAQKHFFKYIRPGAVALKVKVDGDPDVTASAFVHDKNGTLTVELVNKAGAVRTTVIALPGDFAQAKSVQTITSCDKELWKEAAVKVEKGAVSVDLPPYGVMTLVARR